MKTKFCLCFYNLPVFLKWFVFKRMVKSFSWFRFWISRGKCKKERCIIFKRFAGLKHQLLDRLIYVHKYTCFEKAVWINLKTVYIVWPKSFHNFVRFHLVDFTRLIQTTGEVTGISRLRGQRRGCETLAKHTGYFYMWIHR